MNKKKLIALLEWIGNNNYFQSYESKWYEIINGREEGNGITTEELIKKFNEYYKKAVKG